MAAKAFLKFFFFILLIALAREAQAASFKFSPAGGNFGSGAAFGVTVSIDSEGTAINAAEANFSFPVRLLEVASVSTSGSIFKFWAEEPTFSNGAGTVSFSGGLPSPGYTGPSGKIFTINFRTKGAGTANLEVTSGAILANDGLGTNVFSSSQETNYQIKAASVESPPPPATESGPVAPVVSSATHPDENQWYNREEFKASWKLPSGADGVNYALFSNPNYQLPTSSKGLVTEATYDLRSLEDGVWYFFVRFRGKDGWGGIVRRAVRVDRESPEPFTVNQEERKDLTDPRAKISFAATDRTSGIGRAEVKVGGADWLDVEGLELRDEDAYLLPVTPPGRHAVVVRVFDRAGNSAEAATEIEIRPLPTPLIKSYSNKTNPPQQPLVIEAAESEPQPDAGFLERLEHKIKFFFRKGGLLLNFEVPIDGKGLARFEYREHLERGSWLLTAQLVDSRGAVSLETEPVTIKVGGWVSEALSVLGEYAAVVVGGIAALSLIAVAFFFVYSRTLMLRRRFVHDLRRFEKKLDKDALRLDLDLQGRGLFRKPKQRSVRRDIEKIKADIAEELKNIKKK